jgi:hypothetical protein
MRIEVEGDATKLHCCGCGKTVPLQPIRPVPALGLELAGSLLPHAPSQHRVGGGVSQLTAA